MWSFCEARKLHFFPSFFITSIACLLITVRRYSSKCSYFYIITPISFAYADSSRETGIIHEIAAGRTEPGDRREGKRKERRNKIRKKNFLEFIVDDAIKERAGKLDLM